jgi:predicted nucleotidyltransferase
MAVTPREMAEHQLRLVRERAARIATLREKVLSELPGIMEDLRRRFGVRRIVLFGSFARGEIHERSDLDLAVEGLSEKDYYRAVAACLSASVPVDLIRLEDAAESLRRLIDEEGQVLQENPG